MRSPHLTSLFASRSPGSDHAPPPPARGWRERSAAWLPLALLLGFAWLLWLLFGERLAPARAVEVVPVVTIPRGDPGAAEADPAAAAERDPFAAAPLFQASGWIEPDPLPIKATALIGGVVDEVMVLEGEPVARGQLLATLIDEDARLALRAAESALASAEAQAAAHRAEIALAEARLATAGKEILAARARRDEAEDRSRRLAMLPAGNVPEVEVAQARLQLATREAEAAVLDASRAEREGELARLQALAQDLDARSQEAEVAVEQRRLDLSRTRIHSPADGVVLRLLAAPGEKRMLEMDHPDSAVIAILYQPGKLQARIDVPLEEAARLASGQAVLLRSNLLAGKVFRGRVTRIAGEADLQRNTLQAKVRIEDPDPRLRPEMLCRAEFLDPGSPGAASQPRSGGGAGRVQLFAPAAALVDRSGAAARAWVMDPSGDRASLRELSLGEETREGHVAVAEGLLPGDRLVLRPPAGLSPGERLRPKEHDPQP